MKTSEFRKLIREEIRKVLKEVGEADKPFKDVLTGKVIQRGKDFKNDSDIEFYVSGTTNPLTGKKLTSSGWGLKVGKEKADSFAWSNKNDADKLPAKVILSSEYEGDWEDNAPEDWIDDFEAVQNQLAKKFVDGKDFGVMMGMGDDIFNALFVVNPAVLQDPVIKKYIKKIMSYGGLEIKKGKL